MKRLSTIVLVLFVCVVFASCQILCSHEFASELSVAPQCEVDGERTNTCTKCGYAETETVIMTGHSFDAGTVTQEPICDTAGVLTYQCKNCPTTKAEVIPALEHTFDRGSVTRKATCAESGELTYTCALCGKTKLEAIELIPHNLGEESVIKEATCKEEGELAKTCSVCGYAEVVGQIPKTDVHVFEEQELRSPTCVDKGEGQNICTVCGYSEGFEYDYTDHVYDTPVVLLSPTCTEYGEERYDCVYCDHSYTEDLYPYGHDYDSGVTTKEPTCAEEGAVEYTCTECGAIYVEYIPVTDHTWRGGSCNEPAVCEICGETNYSSSGHDYELYRDTPPSEFFIGCAYYACTRCDDRITEYYGATGTYDLDTIRWYVVDYAKSKGFEIVYSCDSLSSYDERCTIRYSSAEKQGGQSLVIQKGLLDVDHLCETLEDCNVDITDCMLTVTVFISQNSTYGSSIVIDLVAYNP